MVSSTLSEFYVREATLDDLKYAQQACDVFNSAYNHSSEGWASLHNNVNNYHTTKEVIEKYIKDSLQDEKIIQLFAFQRHEDGNESVVGTLSVEKDYAGMNKTLEPHDGILGRFCIRPDLQSKGLGKMIIHAGLEAMKKAGYTVCSILVFENRENILRWYEKLGFVNTHEFYPCVLSSNTHLINDYKFILLKRDL